MSANDETTSIKRGFGGKFDELRARYVNTPELVEQYEQTVRTVVTMRRVLMAIDQERRRRRISKSELARRIGMDDSSVRRIFTSESSNPTLKTVVEMLSALSMSVELRTSDAPIPAINSPRRRRKEQVAV